MKQTQNYKNHFQLYPLHHFVLTPLTVGLFIWSLSSLGEWSSDTRNAILFKIIVSFTLIIITLVSRIYGMKNQDRIIRLEMRLRYFERAGKSFKEKEKQLRLGQIIALRFAGDEELLPLMERAISEKLSSKEIKLAIKDWQGDYRRV